MSKELAVAPKDTIRELIQNNKKGFQEALPSLINADRFMKLLLNCILSNNKLLACSKNSLLQAAMESAKLGLEPDGILGQAYIIPYGKLAKFQIGYRGLMELAWRSGKLTSIQAHAVKEKDEFRFSYGLNDDLYHVPSREKDRGDFTHFYACAKFKEGGYVFTVLTKEEVNLVRDRSKAYVNALKYGNQDTPWITDYEPMAVKTAIIRLAKFMPQAAEMNYAASLDGINDFGIEIKDVETEDIETKTSSKTEELKERLSSAKKDNKSLRRRRQCRQCGEKFTKEEAREIAQGEYLCFNCEKMEQAVDVAEEKASETANENSKEEHIKTSTCSICQKEKETVVNSWGEDEERICLGCATASDIICDGCEMPLFEAAKINPGSPLTQIGEDYFCGTCVEKHKS